MLLLSRQRLPPIETIRLVRDNELLGIAGGPLEANILFDALLIRLFLLLIERRLWLYNYDSLL